MSFLNQVDDEYLAEEQLNGIDANINDNEVDEKHSPKNVNQVKKHDSNRASNAKK